MSFTDLINISGQPTGLWGKGYCPIELVIFKVLITVGITCVKHEAWGPAPAH